MFSKIIRFYGRCAPYVRLFVMIAYGLLVVFSLVGILLGRGYLPTVALVLTCLAWCSSRIVSEAFLALGAIRRVADEDDDDN